MLRTCKNKLCRVKFDPKNNGQIVCEYPCSIEYAKQKRKKKEKEYLKQINVTNNAIREKNKTLSQHKKELQVFVNRYVNLRDKGKPCVSCDTPDIGLKRDASHFWSQGGNPSVRFDLNNIFSSCVRCNRDLHGNLLEYRPRLIKKIGKKEFDLLAKRRTEGRVFSIPEILQLKELFKQKIKMIK